MKSYYRQNCFSNTNNWIASIAILVCVTVTHAKNANDDANDIAQLPMQRTVQLGSVQLSTSIDRKQINIADPFELRINAEAPDAISMVFPDDHPDQLGDFNIVSQHQIGPIPILGNETDSPDRYRKTVVYRIESLRAGIQTIAPITFDAIGLDSQETLQTEPIRINVLGVVPPDQDPTEFQDLKPLAVPAVDPPPVSDWRWAIPFAGLVLGASLWGLRTYRRSETRQRKRWIAEIDRIETDLANRSIESTEAHDEACGTVRQWIQWQERIPATSQAADQLVEQLRHRTWTSSMLDRLSSMLNRNDMLKFSSDHNARRQAVSDQGLTSVFDDARWLMIQSTKKREGST